MEVELPPTVSLSFPSVSLLLVSTTMALWRLLNGGTFTTLSLLMLLELLSWSISGRSAATSSNGLVITLFGGGGEVSSFLVGAAELLETSEISSGFVGSRISGS